MLRFFFFNDPATTGIYTLSLHDALPISGTSPGTSWYRTAFDLHVPAGHDASLALTIGDPAVPHNSARSEEHTSELQSRPHLVCRLLLEKKKTPSLGSPLPISSTLAHVTS